MQFHRTVDSLFPLVQEIPITHEHALASLLRRYEQQLEQASVGGPDRSLLEQAQSLLQERLATTNLDSDLLLLAMWIHNGAMPYDPYLWLAASLWATTHQTERVFVLLRQAAQRYSDGADPWQKFRRLPEFAAVQDDPSFRHAADSN